MKRFRGLHRTEAERQALIAELRRLRLAGVNVDRQDVIERELRETFELGWPDPASVWGSRPSRKSNGQVQA